MVKSSIYSVDFPPRFIVVLAGRRAGEGGVNADRSAKMGNMNQGLRYERWGLGGSGWWAVRGTLGDGGLLEDLLA